MLSNPIQIAEAINHPKFHAGDEVVLVEGPHKYVRGIFVSLKEDVEWAAVREANGAINSHPVEWMRNMEDQVLLTRSQAGQMKKEEFSA